MNVFPLFILSCFNFPSFPISVYSILEIIRVEKKKVNGNGKKTVNDLEQTLNLIAEELRNQCQ